MHIEEQTQGAVTVLRPQGPLIKADADAFKTRLLEVSARSLGRVVIDASGIAYVDSRGLEVMVEAARELSEGARTLKVSGVNDVVREVLNLTDVGSALDLYEDAATAVRSFV